ncbi:MAG: hypothetical protein ACE5FZ_07310 [Nitrospiria bacterium]
MRCSGCGKKMKLVAQPEGFLEFSIPFTKIAYRYLKFWNKTNYWCPPCDFDQIDKMLEPKCPRG